ncbi:MAG: S41 family peptidase [Actinomycetota bacterium]|nr:S41 family peptidase [Actinomycetota bacterium]
MKRTTAIIVGLFVLLIFFAGVFTTGVLVGRHLEMRRPAMAPSESLELLREVLGIVQKSYIESVPTKKLVIGAIKGLLGALGDPYTRYLDPSDLQMLEEGTRGRFYGVGIEIGLKDDQLTVISPLPETPAARAGIKAEDKIVEIDGKSTKGMSLERAVKSIRGEEGTTVVLTISRKGVDEPLKFSLVREEIKIPNVVSKMMDELGYIRVHSFSEDTGLDFEKALDELKKKGAQGIILDLRNNPGGLLRESVSVASQFIESGPIVVEKFKDGRERTYNAYGEADEEIPLVVLINKGSASASEIVAGAIQDKERGVLIGEQTFGKGSVQTVEELSDGSGLLITTAIYLTPEGRKIHKKGIKPDIVVSIKEEKPLHEKDDQLEKAKEVLRNIISGKDWKKAA